MRNTNWHHRRSVFRLNSVRCGALCFCLVVLCCRSSLLLALEGASLSSPQSIELQMGQTREYTSPADLVFAADDSIVKVVKKGGGNVTLLGLKPGETQIIFSNQGVLSHVSVKITAAPTAANLLLTPQFRPHAPYLLYEFGNNSSFTNAQFYQHPNYSHTLTLNTPLGSAHVQAVTQFIQDNGQKKFTNGLFTMQTRHVDFLFGNEDVSIGRLVNAVLSGVPAYGPRFRMLNPFLRHSHLHETLDLFGGIKPQTELRNLRWTERKAGFDYTISSSRFHSLLQDFFNAGFVAYQSPNQTQYRYSGALETAYHLIPHLQLGTGAYVGHGGFGILMAPVWESTTGLIRSQYRFVKHGLEKPDGQSYGNTEHSYQVNAQQILRDQITILTGNIGHTISLDTTGTSGIPSSNTFGSSLGVVRQLSFAKRYGISYAFSHASTNAIANTTNSVTGLVAHPMTAKSYLEHSLSLSQNNPTTHQRSRSLQLSDLYQYESARSRHRLALNTTAMSGIQNSVGITLNATNDFFFRGATLQGIWGYTKANIQDDTHQFQIGSRLLFQPTTTQLLTLTAIATAVRTSMQKTISGSVAFVYRQYLGPGVERDSLIKKIFTGSNHQTIGGRVFMDNNYTGSLDEGDSSLEGTPIVLDGKVKTTTGPQGAFAFTRVRPGTHHIAVEPKADQGVNVPFTYHFSVGVKGKKNISIPVTIPKAIVTARTLVDANDNGTVDADDVSAAVSKITLIPPRGADRTSGGEGGAIFNGVETGQNTIRLDPTGFAEGLSLIGDIAQTINVTDYKEYVVTFLFKPLRSLRGRIHVEGGGKLPTRLTLHLGDATATADTEGYYWFKTLKEGQYDLTITHIPPGYCIQGGSTIPVHVGSPYMGVYDIILTSRCGDPSRNP